MKNSGIFIFTGGALVAFGVVLNTTLKEKVGALGVAMIGIGGLLLVIGMKKKQEED